MKILILQFAAGYFFGCTVGALLMRWLFSRRLYRPSQLKEAFRDGYRHGAADALLSLSDSLHQPKTPFHSKPGGIT